MFDKVYIDGDWLLFLVAATCEENYIEVKDTSKPDEPIKEYKNKTAFKAYLKGAGESFDETVHLIESKKRLKREDIFPLSTQILKNKAHKIRRDSLASNIVIALGGETNFRDRLPLPVKYKGNRDGVQKPLLLKSLSTWMAKNFEVEYAVDQEADDIISINQYEGSKTNKTVVCTLDKDSRGTPGYLHNPTLQETLNIEGLGYCELIVKTGKSKLYGVGRVWEYIQWISGDKVDNYHPQDLLSKRLIVDKRSNLIVPMYKKSDSKIYEEVKDFTTDKEWFQYIHDLFYSWYKDLEWYYTWDDILIENATYLDILQVYVDVVHMRRWEDDRVLIKDILQKQDIELLCQ